MAKPDRATRRNLYRQQRKLAAQLGAPAPRWHDHCLAAPPSKKPKPEPIETEGMIKALFK